MEMELTYLFYFVLFFSFLVWIAGRPKKVKKRVPESVSDSGHNSSLSDTLSRNWMTVPPKRISITGGKP